MVGTLGMDLEDPRWRRILVLAVTETISWGILFYAFSVLLVPMQESLGAGRGELSAAFSIAVVVRALAAPLAGAWVDRHGVRSLMTAGSSVAVLLVLAWSTVTDVRQLMLVFAGIGLASAAVLYEPAFAAAARWMRASDRGTAILVITVAAGLASTIFLPMTSALSEALGWREALRWLALVLLVGTAVPHALFLAEPRADSDASSVSPGAGSDRTTAGRAAADEAVRRSVRTADALRDPAFWWMSVAFVCGRAPMAAMAAHLPALLLDRGESAATAAALSGAVGALSVTGRVVLTLAARRRSMSELLGAIFLLQGLGLVLLAFVPTRMSAVVFIVLFGIGFGATTIAKPVMVVDRYGHASYGAIAGAIAALTTLAEATAPVAVGIGRDAAGDYGGSLLLLALVFLIGAVATRRTTREDPPATLVRRWT